MVRRAWWSGSIARGRRHVLFALQLLRFAADFDSMSTVPQQSSLLSTVLEAGVSKACFHVATELIFEELSAGRGVTLPGLGTFTIDVRSAFSAPAVAPKRIARPSCSYRRTTNRSASVLRRRSHRGRHRLT